MARALPVLMVLLLAGCVGQGGTVEPGSSAPASDAEWWLTSLPSTLEDPDHDHTDYAMHQGLTTPNFQVLGYDPLVTDEYGATATGMGCGGAVKREDGQKLAIVQSISTDVGFVVADITDPAAPVKLGEFYMPNAIVWDADISADGQHVIVAADINAPIFGGDAPKLPIPPGAPATPEIPFLVFRACNGEERAVGPANYFPFGPGVVLVGIQDPTQPTLEDWVPQPWIGPHSVGSSLIDGTLYATTSVTNLVHETSYYNIFTVEGSKLVPSSVIQVPGHPGVGRSALNGHVDMTLQKHPLTGQVLAHLANWDGYYVYDISGPVPMEVGSWFDGDEGQMHTATPFPTAWGDKHYIVLGQEVGEPDELPSGWIYLVDITDPATPTEVGRWTLPVKPKWDGGGGLQFSTHYVALLNTTLFVATYHGGLWAVDVSDLANPLAIGHFMPDRAPADTVERGLHEPSLEDVIVDPETGVLTTWDGPGGIYQLRFDENAPKVPAPAWPHESE